MKKIIALMLASIFLLSACGAEPEPTMSPEDVQGTAIAAAWTIVAETQAAIPTNTPIPPTATATLTPLPTNTVPPLELPTQSLLSQPTATTESSGDECDRVLRSDPPGPKAPILIRNKTKAPINVSLYLEKTPFGECGYRGYSVPKNGEIKIEFPQGVIYGYAWILEPINTVVQGGPWKPNNTDKWTIEVNDQIMKMIGP
jgi:hypothetical protein